MPYKDKNKQREYQRRWTARKYASNPELKKYWDGRKARQYAWFMGLKSRLECEICGENEPVCLDFHHVSDDKYSEVSKMVWKGYSLKRILEEMAKCAVVCANCHRKITSGLIVLEGSTDGGKRI